MKKIFISLLLALMSVVGAWAQDYLTMKAVGGSVTIGMTKNGTPADYDLQHSFDKQTWTTVALNATNDNIVEIPVGQTCYFRHGTETAIGRISSSADNYWTFTMTGTGTIEAGGNIMSLLDATAQKNNIGSSFAFTYLFKGCGKLTKTPRLPATSISERCYMGMFEESGIIEAPQLPAASVIKGSYQNMFKNCQNLEKAPKLLATRVNWVGYQEMFYGCKKIKEVTIGEITTIENGNAFTRWLDGTAYGTNGVLFVPESMKSISFSLPSNWRMMTRSEYIAEYEPTAVSFTFEGDGMPIETEHRLEGMKMTFSNDGEKMTVMVNGAKVTYDLSNVGELVHFRGTPTVSLTPRENPADPGYYYTTFYSGLEAYTIPDGVQAYTAELTSAINTVTIAPITGNVLPQDEAVLLKSTSAEAIKLETTNPTTGNKVANNSFEGVDMFISRPEGSVYLLSDLDNMMAFYLFTGDIIPANNAFIHIPAGMSAPDKIVWKDHSTPTGDSFSINLQGATDNEKVEKFIRNGTLYIRKGEHVYNVQGVIVK